MTENGSSSACFLRKCGAGRRAILKKSSFDGRMKAAGTAQDLISEENGRVRREQTGGAYAVFYAKSSQKPLKVLFMVSELCDTVFTGEAPGTKRKHRRETP